MLCALLDGSKLTLNISLWPTGRFWPSSTSSRLLLSLVAQLHVALLFHVFGMLAHEREGVCMGSLHGYFDHGRVNSLITSAARTGP